MQQLQPIERENAAKTASLIFLNYLCCRNKVHAAAKAPHDKPKHPQPPVTTKWHRHPATGEWVKAEEETKMQDDEADHEGEDSISLIGEERSESGEEDQAEGSPHCSPREHGHTRGAVFVFLFSFHFLYQKGA